MNIHANCTQIACKAARQEPLHFCVNKIKYGINNELERTETNSDHSEFLRVRIFSLSSLLLAQAHERVPSKLAVHLRLSRMGG